MGIDDFETKYFTDPQITLIRAICVYQMDSLNRIINNNMACDDIDLTMYLIENEVGKDEFQKSLYKGIARFETIYKEPDDLRLLDQEEISMFKHLLANIENNWLSRYPNAVRNLWSRLNIIEKTQNGMYTQGQLN